MCFSQETLPTSFAIYHAAAIVPDPSPYVRTCRDMDPKVLNPIHGLIIKSNVISNLEKGYIPTLFTFLEIRDSRDSENQILGSMLQFNIGSFFFNWFKNLFIDIHITSLVLN